MQSKNYNAIGFKYRYLLYLLKKVFIYTFFTWKGRLEVWEKKEWKKTKANFDRIFMALVDN